MKKLTVLTILSALLICCLPLFGCGKKSGGEGIKDSATVNTVILVNLKEGGFGEGYSAELAKKLNGEGNSVREFFKAESLGRCLVNSTVVGEVTVSAPKEYYLPSGSVGYEDKTVLGKPHVEVFLREQMLIREVLSLVTLPDGYVSDGDGDGACDGITFVINEDFTDDKNRILWSHKSSFYPCDEGIEEVYYVPSGYLDGAEEKLEIPSLGGAVAGDYAIVSKNSSVGEICHELSHVLGMPDYYSYVDGIHYDNIGKFDLMGASTGEVPQFSLSYVRMKMGWLKEGEDVKVIDDSCSINLSPVTAGEVQAVKIIPPNSREKGQFFMAEVRQKAPNGSFEDSLYDSCDPALIIYRVTPENAFIGANGILGNSDCGNMYGNGRFEVELFTNNFLNYFDGGTLGKNEVDLTYSGGESSGVKISEITDNKDGTMFFSVAFEGESQIAEFEPEITPFAGGLQCVKWDKFDGEYAYIMGIKATSRSAAAYALNALPKARQVIEGDSNGYEISFYEKVSSASGFCLPKIDEECYVIVAADTEKPEQRIFHVGVAGRPNAEFGFADWFSVMFSPWQPAFIGAICLAVLLAVCFVIVAIKAAKRSRKQTTEGK